MVLQGGRSGGGSRGGCLRSGYDAFKAFAAEIGRAGEWVEWSEGEPCPQRDVQNDTEVDHGWTPWCQIGSELLE